MTKVPQQLSRHVARHRSAWQGVIDAIVPRIGASRARIVAISGSQGSGKSTLAQLLVDALVDAGSRSAAVSIDDFYLTRAERAALADRVHPLLATRGVPGTHDTGWFARTLERVRAGESEVVVPRFDKGADDRTGEEAVRADLLVIEGWCLGVQAQPASLLREPINRLERDEDRDGTWRRYVNDAIVRDYAPLWPLVDFWVHLRVPGFEQVLEWRTQQEKELPRAQQMSADEIGRFVAHYERCTRSLWASTPQAPGIVVELDRDHAVSALTTLAVD